MRITAAGGAVLDGFAATCAAIAEERESRYINGGDE